MSSRESIQALDRACSKLEGARDAALARLALLDQEIQEARSREDILLATSELFRTLVDKELTESVTMTEQLLTEGLRAVFSDMDLSCRAVTEISRGKVSVNFLVRHVRPDGTVSEGEAEDGFGGAVTTVMSVILRIVLMLRRNMQRVLFLDESLPALENRYIQDLVSFLETLCKRLELDMLIITHNPILVQSCKTAYRIRTTPHGAVFGLG